MPSEYTAVDVKCCGCFNFLKRRYREVKYGEHQVKATAAIQQRQHVDNQDWRHPPTVPSIQVNRGGSSSSADQHRISEVRSITEMDYRRRPYLFEQQEDPRSHFNHNYYLDQPASYHHPPPPDDHHSSRQLTPQFYYNNYNGGYGRYGGNFLAIPPTAAEQGIVKVDYDNFPNQSYAGCTVW